MHFNIIAPFEDWATNKEMFASVTSDYYYYYVKVDRGSEVAKEISTSDVYVKTRWTMLLIHTLGARICTSLVCEGSLHVFHSLPVEGVRQSAAYMRV